MQHTDAQDGASKPKRGWLGTSDTGANKDQQQQASKEMTKVIPMADENLVDVVSLLSLDDQVAMRLTSRQLQRTVNQKKEQTLRPLHDVVIHPGGAEICVTSDDEEPRVLYSLEEAFLWADYSYVKALTLGAVTWTETDGSTIDRHGFPQAHYQGGVSHRSDGPLQESAG